MASWAGAVAWIFGHHHWSHGLDVHGVKLLAAQPGYPGEDTDGPDRVSSPYKGGYGATARIASS